MKKYTKNQGGKMLPITQAKRAPAFPPGLRTRASQLIIVSIYCPRSLTLRVKRQCVRVFLSYEIITGNLSYKRDEWRSIVLPAVLHEERARLLAGALILPWAVRLGLRVRKDSARR